MRKYTILLAFFGALFFAQAQETEEPTAEELAKQNWFHADFATDSIYGTASDAAYKYAASKRMKPSPVLVAVIDSGIDIEHEDLKDVLWVNKDEVPGNGIDDDKNGYVDDIHGWNFIGGADGQNVDADNLEITRLVRIGMNKFESPDEFTNKTNQEKFPEEYEKYKEMKKEVEGKLAEAKMQVAGIGEQMNQMITAFEGFGNEYGMDKVITIEDLKAFEPTSDFSKQMKMGFLMAVNTEKASEIFGKTPKFFVDEIQKEIDSNRALNYYQSQLKQYDVNFDPRSIVGDNYDDKTEKYYGNNDVDGPDSLHGTHVAGIIGAEYHNGIGMDGIARNVEIMSVRTVPNGDERDKDVANAIRYAVDNGAKIINMSFGKAYSPEKELVWDAIQYATEKGVLLVHAAGNDNKDVDTEDNFPTNYRDGKEVSNTWLTVGASSRYNDKVKASFSNFGKTQVDIFAPGLEIYSTTPEDTYEFLQGTSMAAPAVSGVAALVWSFYPELTAAQLRNILIESGNVHPDLVKISKEGKVADALHAMQMAEKMLLKKKVDSDIAPSKRKPTLIKKKKNRVRNKNKAAKSAY